MTDTTQMNAYGQIPIGIKNGEEQKQDLQAALADVFGWNTATLKQPAPQQEVPSVASKAVLAAIRAANFQLVRTGDDAFMLVTLKQPAPQQAAPEVTDDLRDRLVAISEAIADQDDRGAQAMLREILKAQPAPSGDAEDAARLDWIAIRGSFGVDSVSGLVGGNGQRCVAATRKNIDAARKEVKP